MMRVPEVQTIFLRCAVKQWKVGTKIITSEQISFWPIYPNTFLTRIYRCIDWCRKNIQLH